MPPCLRRGPRRAGVEAHAYAGAEPSRTPRHDQRFQFPIPVSTMNILMRDWKLALILTFAACGFLLMACGGPPSNNPLLDEARTSVNVASNDSAIVAGGAESLDRAEATLRRGERLLAEGADKEEVEHYAYLTSRHVAIAEELARLKRREEAIRRAEVERQQVVLEARERDARKAQLEAETERREADSARERADEAQARAGELDERVREMEARETRRGLMLTLSEVLFDVGRANLKESGQRAVGQLAAFLQDYPERQVLVEGHTDNSGSDRLNLELSRRRAEAVKAALMEEGIAGNRVRTEGLGSAYPVAENNTTAGRQQNRRVEIIISDERGVIRGR